MISIGKRKHGVFLALLVFFSLLTAGCAKNTETARIEYMDLGNTGKSFVEIPQFVTNSGESTRALEKLNKDLEFLKDLYEDASRRTDGAYVEIRSYPESNSRFLTVTTTYRTFPIGESEGDLITLAYDRETDTAITPEDALEQSGIAGDQLSIDVHAAYVASGGQLEVTSTEMQGFELADDGTLDAIYMKLWLYDEKTDTEQQIFCRYIPADGTLSIKDFGEGMGGGE